MPRELKILLSRYASEEREINACQINQGDILWFSQLGRLIYVDRIEVLRSEIKPIFTRGRLDYEQTCKVRVHSGAEIIHVNFDAEVNYLSKKPWPIVTIVRVYSLPYSDEVRELLRV